VNALHTLHGPETRHNRTASERIPNMDTITITVCGPVEIDTVIMPAGQLVHASGATTPEVEQQAGQVMRLLAWLPTGTMSRAIELIAATYTPRG